jgi:hypothetical protein
VQSVQTARVNWHHETHELGVVLLREMEHVLVEVTTEVLSEWVSELASFFYLQWFGLRCLLWDMQMMTQEMYVLKEMLIYERN